MIVLISILLVIIVTEICYFGFVMEGFKNNNANNVGIFGIFIVSKIVSLCIGILSLLFLIAIPLMIKEQEGYTYLQVFGWYYGVLVSVFIFFGINWLITKHLDKKKKNE